MFEKGYLLSERYEIAKVIGEGGMANVYKAFDIILQRHVAIKVLRGDLSDDELFVRRFRREALASTSLNHPNIVQIYDVGDENGKYYIVMEYVEGITLKQLLLKRKQLTVAEVLDISKQVMAGIAHAHSKQIVHRDIKPHNIMVQRDGTIKITDFGIAVTLNATLLTQTNSILGSVHYLPPEQISGNIADTKSDMYSIGILMYELLTGELPFNGESAVTIALMHVKNKFPSPRDIDKSIPQGLENIIIRSTAKNPKNRYESVEKMRMDLLNYKRRENANKLVLDDKMEEETINLLLNKNDEIEDKKPEDNGNKKRIRLFVIIGIILSLIVASVFIIPRITQPERIVVPDVISLKRGEATEILNEEGFNVSPEVIFESSDEFEVDTVISTNVDVGSEHPLGFTIVLTVSTGPDKYVMEDFIGKNIDEARTSLENKGIVVSVIDKETNDVSNLNIIIDQTPIVGTQVASGEVVTLFVPMEKNFYPDMVADQYTRLDVDRYCEESAIACTIREDYSDTVALGTVVSQSIPAGQEIVSTDALTVVISLGKEPETSTDG